MSKGPTGEQPLSLAPAPSRAIPTQGRLNLLELKLTGWGRRHHSQALGDCAKLRQVAPAHPAPNLPRAGGPTMRCGLPAAGTPTSFPLLAPVLMPYGPLGFLAAPRLWWATFLSLPVSLPGTLLPQCCLAGSSSASGLNVPSSEGFPDHLSKAGQPHHLLLSIREHFEVFHDNKNDSHPICRLLSVCPSPHWDVIFPCILFPGVSLGPSPGPGSH